MRALFILGRAIFGGFFLYNGINHFQHLDQMAPYAAAKGVRSPEQAVQASGALLLAGGLGVLTGLKPKLGLAAIISFLIPKLKSMGMNLEGANYFRFFTLLMLATSVIYVFVSRHFRERTHLQTQVPEDELVTEPLLAGGTPT